MSRDWQKDIEIIHKARYEYKLDNLNEVLDALSYWLQQVKTLKEDNARLTCQFTGAEQKYLTQSNVIAVLRERVEKAEVKAENWRREAFMKYPTPEAYEAACAALEKHRERADKAEEREQKIRGLLEIAMGGLIARGSGKVADNLKRQLSTLYPLDMEDTNNGSDD